MRVSVLMQKCRRKAETRSPLHGITCGWCWRSICKATTYDTYVPWHEREEDICLFDLFIFSSCLPHMQPSRPSLSAFCPSYLAFSSLLLSRSCLSSSLRYWFLFLFLPLVSLSHLVPCLSFLRSNNRLTWTATPCKRPSLTVHT